MGRSRDICQNESTISEKRAKTDTGVHPCLYGAHTVSQIVTCESAGQPVQPAYCSSPKDRTTIGLSSVPGIATVSAESSSSSYSAQVSMSLDDDMARGVYYLCERRPMASCQIYQCPASSPRFPNARDRSPGRDLWGRSRVQRLVGGGRPRFGSLDFATVVSHCRLKIPLTTSIPGSMGLTYLQRASNEHQALLAWDHCSVVWLLEHGDWWTSRAMACGGGKRMRKCARQWA